MGNFMSFPGMFLEATEDHTDINTKEVVIKKGDVVQLLTNGLGLSQIFTFVGINGVFEKTGKGWEPTKRKL